MQNKEKTFSTEWLGRTLTFKIGRLALQADAAVTVQYGDTVVLATVVESKEERDIPFFPLMVDFEERLYAAGIIKGSQWIKREGRPSDEAVLTGRMIDRSIRPLFDESSRREVQVIITILSVDNENDHDIVSLVAASAALCVSGVNWQGPIAGIRVARVDNEFIYNPTFLQREKSDLDLIVAGTVDKVIQIEAGANEITEDVMYEAITSGKEKMAPAIELIKEMQKNIEIPKKNYTDKEMTIEEIEINQVIDEVVENANNWLKNNVNQILFNKEYYAKKERKAAVVEIKTQLKEYLKTQKVELAIIEKVIKKTVDKAVDTEITKELIENKRRVDGRDIKEIRQLTSAIDILPRNHGAGLFSRGETQIMSIATLAGPGLAQSIEGLSGNSEKRYMHHYNFAPFSVGETRFMRGPGRREIGHGALAEKAILPVLPSKEEFPYTIRVVSETLGSNGSSSMGATCGSTLALMDAGVPIKKAVAGLAIGLASYDDMRAWQVITDIQDLEDGKGGMDFKVTGTDEGITAIQLDTKTLGITNEIIKEALNQGKEGRLKIIEVMKNAISEPRKELSKYAPRITTLQIDPEKIRDVIGAGGKVINGIIDATGVTIDIDDNGTVVVCGTDQEKSEEAINIIKNITRKFEVGEKFHGKVVRIMDFGAFVEIAPGRDGMVHVSELAPYRIGKPANFLDIGDEVTVRVKEIDDQERVNLSMKGLVENQKLWENKKGEQISNGFNNRSNNNYNNRNKQERHRPKFNKIGDKKN